jgi:predicted transcriptional regulator
MTTVATRAVAIKIDQGTRERIKRLAESRQRTPHWLMREAISQYVEREEKRAAFRQGAVNAWNEYQETGLHVTGEEVVAWLDTWGEEQEKAAPVCHK